MRQESKAQLTGIQSVHSLFALDRFADRNVASLIIIDRSTARIKYIHTLRPNRQSSSLHHFPLIKETYRSTRIQRITDIFMQRVMIRVRIRRLLKRTASVRDSASGGRRTARIRRIPVESLPQMQFTTEHVRLSRETDVPHVGVCEGLFVEGGDPGGGATRLITAWFGPDDEVEVCWEWMTAAWRDHRRLVGHGEGASDRGGK